MTPRESGEASLCREGTEDVVRGEWRRDKESGTIKVLP